MPTWLYTGIEALVEAARTFLIINPKQESGKCLAVLAG